MNTNQKNIKTIIGRFIFGTLLLSIIYRFISTSLVHQLCSPVFIYPHVDLTYWGLHLLHIPEFISGSFITALSFDVILFASTLMACIFPRKRWICGISISSYFLYIIMYNTYSLHHTHPMMGGIIITLPFLFKQEKDFKLLWEGIRYYALWVYASAFIWKLFRGTFFHLEHGEATFKAMHTTYLAHHPQTWLSQTIEWLIIHPFLAHLFLCLGFIIQGLFLIGFFTKKYDWIWFTLPFIFHITTHFFIEVVFFELLILNFAFIPFSFWNKYSN